MLQTVSPALPAGVGTARVVRRGKAAVVGLVLAQRTLDGNPTGRHILATGKKIYIEVSQIGNCVE